MISCPDLMQIRRWGEPSRNRSVHSPFASEPTIGTAGDCAKTGKVIGIAAATAMIAATRKRERRADNFIMFDRGPK